MAPQKQRKCLIFLELFYLPRYITMHEHYSWAGRRLRLSAREIKQMRENMRKVPLIQAKSDSYHQKEAAAAERLLNNALETPSISSTQQPPTRTQPLSFFQRLKRSLFW